MLAIKKLSSKKLYLDPKEIDVPKNSNSTNYNSEKMQSLSNAALQVKNFLSNCLVHVDAEDKKVYNVEEEMKKIKDSKEAMKGTIFDINELPNDEEFSRRRIKGEKKQKLDDGFQVIKLRKCGKKADPMIGNHTTSSKIEKLAGMNETNKEDRRQYKRKQSYQAKSPMVYLELLDKKNIKDSNIWNKNSLKSNSEESSIVNPLSSPARLRRTMISPSSSKKHLCELLTNESKDEKKANNCNYNKTSNAKIKEFKEICTSLKDSIISSPDLSRKLSDNLKIASKKYDNEDEDDFNGDEELAIKKRNQEIKEIKFRCLEKHKKLVYDSLSDEESDEEISGDVYLLPSSLTKIYLDAGIIILTIYSFIFTPYSIAFDFVEIPCIVSWKNVMEFLIDFYFGLDLIMGFFTAYYDFEEQLITHISQIALNYTMNWFGADFLCAIPFNSFIIWLNSRYLEITYTFTQGGTKLTDLLRLIRLIKFFKVFFNNSCANAIYKTVIGIDVLARKFRMLLSLFVFFLSVHLLSCVFIFLGQMDYPNWISEQSIDIRNTTEVYVTSLYYICATVFTIGYGDVLSVSTYERFFNLLLLVVGIMIYSWAVTSLSNYVQSVDSKTLDYQKRVAILEQIRMTHEKMPNCLYDKISRFLKYKFNNEKKDKNEIIDNLPIALRNSLIIEMYKPIINNFIFFKNFDNTDFIVQVILAFKPIQATKNEKLINEGDYLEGIIFVKRGSLALEIPLPVVLKDDILMSIQRKKTIYNQVPKQTSLIKSEPVEIEYNEMKNTLMRKRTLASFNQPVEQQPKVQQQYIKIIEIRRNEHFGDILMFLNRRSPLTVKVKSKVAEIFLLKKTDAVEISMQFPRIWRKIIKKSLFNMEQIERLINKALRFFFIHNEGGTKMKKKNWHYYHKDITKKNTLLSSQVLLNQLKNEDMCELQSIPTSDEISEESLTEELIGEEEQEEDDVILETDREDEDDSKFVNNSNDKSRIEQSNDNYDESEINHKENKDSDSSNTLQSIPFNLKEECDENTVYADSTLRKKDLHSLIDSSSGDQTSRKKENRLNSSQLNTLPFSQDEINQENYPDENSINLVQESLIPSIMPKEPSVVSVPLSNINNTNNNNDNFLHFFNGEKSRETRLNYECNHSPLNNKSNKQIKYDINTYFPVNHQFTDVQIAHPISFTLKKTPILNKKTENKKSRSLIKSMSLVGPVAKIENLNLNKRKQIDEISNEEENMRHQSLHSHQSLIVQDTNGVFKNSLISEKGPSSNLPLRNANSNSSQKQTKKAASISNSSNMLEVISQNIERNSLMLNNPKSFYSKYFSQVKVKEEEKDSNKVISKKLLGIVKLIENHNPEKGKIINSNVV